MALVLGSFHGQSGGVSMTRKLVRARKSTKRGKCKFCGSPGQRRGKNSAGEATWKSVCVHCLKKPWRRYRKDCCEECGFVPTHFCQLDVDHVDGNKANSSPANLRTLCANCHRLKTQMRGESSNLQFRNREVCEVLSSQYTLFI